MPQFDRLGNDMSDDIADALALEERDRSSLPEDDMYFDPAQEAREDEIGAMYGDARRCPRHPHVKTSSDDGMFDCDCGECEYESEMAYQEWECNPDNPTRLHCAPETYIASQATHTVGCDDTDEEIPF